jgi:branched-chain amino acid transport system ATP-binding protein
VLEVRGLRAGYDASPVLQDLELDVRPGEVVGVLGGNGSGKSTLLSTLSGLLRPTAGSIRLNGTRLDGLSAERVASRGMRLLSQQRRVFPGLTIRENLLAPALAIGKPDRQAIQAFAEAWLQTFPALGDRADRAAAGLSGGQQQLLAIGRVLSVPSTVLLLDEPSAGLSTAVADQVAGLLKDRAAEGVGLVLVEQDLRFAERLADRVLHLRGGRLV